jgi:hypothetical protein
LASWQRLTGKNDSTNLRSSLAGMPLSVSTVFQSLRSQATERGEVHGALTDSADNFLNVALDALQLNFREIELRPLP